MPTNRYPGSCQRCWQWVEPGEGHIERRGDQWLVQHLDDDCPPYPGGYDGPTWIITDGEPGPFHPRPTSQWDVGEVLRARVQGPVDLPDNAPGLRRDAYRTSAIVTVLAEAEPIYCRDEDGDSPPPLIGEDGWWFQARVRPATQDEAAEILAEEHAQEYRNQLHTRRKNLLSFRACTEDADAPEDARGLLNTAREVPFGAENRLSPNPVDKLFVDDTAGVVWSLTHNGADGDSWAANNYNGYIARRHPLTEDRATLIRELRAEYELPTWKRHAGIPEDAARVLIDNDWTWKDAAYRGLAQFKMETAADAHTVLARGQHAWEQAGWWGSVSQGGTRFRPSNAETLADAGISYHHAAARYLAGFRTVEEILQAAPPNVPDEPGRLMLTPRRHSNRGKVTTDPQLARDFLARNPDYWQPVTHDPGITPVHVGDGWSLWSDGSLVRGSEWLTLHQRPGGAASAPAPTNLSAAGAHALDLIATARNDSCRDRTVWHPLREATNHTEHEQASDSRSSGSWEETKTLTRHDYTVPGRDTISLWELHTDAGGLVGGEGEYAAQRRAFPTEREAREAYRQHTLH